MRLTNLYKNAAIILTMHNLISSAISRNSDWYDLLLEKILSGPQIYQITLFSSEKSRAHIDELNSIFKKTILQIPTVSIDVLTAIRPIDDDPFLGLPVFRNPKPSTFYVIFHQDESLSYLRNTIKFFAELSPTPPRPKCLLVSFAMSSTEQSWTNDSSKVDLKEMLRYAWSLKFLDFALLRVTDNDQPMFFEEYNPFFGTFSQTDMSFGKLVFQDKMKDMNGFVVNIPFVDNPPHSYVNTDMHMRDGFDYETTKLISRTLNYRTKTVHYGYLSSSEILEKLRSSEINVTDYTNLIGSALYKRGVLRGRAYRTDYIVVVVPIRSGDSVSSVSIDFFTVFVYVSLSCLITVSIVTIAILFKFTSGLWKVSYVIQILLGVAVDRKPKACVERIVFLTITMISFIYLTDLVADLTDKIVTKKELVSNSLEELNRSSLPIYMNKLYLRKDMYDYNEELFKIIERNVRGSNRSFRCALDSIEKRDRICIMPLSIARYAIAKQMNVDMSPVLKVIDPPLLYDFAAFAYEKASPFIDKFNKVLCKIVESGILLKFMDEEMRSKALVRNATDTAFQNHNIACLDLIVILMIGFLGSTVVFLAELVVKAIKG